MDAAKQSMIEEAQRRFGTIFPVGQKKSFDDCFTVFRGNLMFWFNTETGSTRMIVSECDGSSTDAFIVSEYPAAKRDHQELFPPL